MYGIRQISNNYVEIYDLSTQYVHSVCHMNKLNKMLRLLTAFKNFYRYSSDNA
jgi:hypothetical protein